jgi:RNase adaptor protein for sRNA GlmZ degradation
MSGLPVDWVHGGGFIFDCRCLENPGKSPEYGDISLLDHNVDLFFDDNSLNKSFIDDAIKMVVRSIESYKKKNYTSLTVSFGSTGGQHRSVYCTEKMASYLRKIGGVEVLVKHRDIRL